MVRGRRVAGVGGVVWGGADRDSARAVIAKATVAIPSQHYAAYAEAFGCRTALIWLVARGGYARAARVAGDNLAVVRYCAQVGRLRRLAIQRLLEASLANVYARGWCLDWVAVRRILNKEADALATAGIMRAARMAETGNMDTEVC